jgi:putative hydrolase of the HAD superfamily
VIGVRPDTDRLRKLVALDSASWLHPDEEVLAAERAARRGYRLAILSNAPIELADEPDRVPWLVALGSRLFSCRLRWSKPDPEILQGAFARLDSAADQVCS